MKKVNCYLLKVGWYITTNCYLSIGARQEAFLFIREGGTTLVRSDFVRESVNEWEAVYESYESKAVCKQLKRLSNFCQIIKETVNRSWKISF